MKKNLLLAVFMMTTSLVTKAQTTTTLTLQPGAFDGKDAEIFSCVPCGYDVRNFGNNKDLNAIAWTNSGTHSFIRSLIQFDLSSIPAGSTITSARLSLYYNADNSEGQHVSSILFKNTTVINRITTNWSESTVTWNTQPTVASLHKVILPASTSPTQSYPNINVIALVQDMINNPTHSFGFRLKMKIEDEPRKLLFASSDNLNAALHPKLVVTYTHPAPRIKAPETTPLRVNQESNSKVLMDIFPNPANDVVNISAFANESGSALLKIYNITGREVYCQILHLTNGVNNLPMQTKTWMKGVYFVSIKTSKEVITKKLIIE